MPTIDPWARNLHQHILAELRQKWGKGWGHLTADHRLAEYHRQVLALVLSQVSGDFREVRDCARAVLSLYDGQP